MPRSPVKTGLHVQRSRATTRRRDRGEEPAHGPDPHDQFQAWLEEHVRLDSIQDIKALDRKRFLQETGNFDVPPGGRLQRLAIHAEWEAACADQPDGWLTLRSIYEHALRFNEPDPWSVYLHMAVSAEEIAGLQNDPAIRDRIAADGIAAGSRAVELLSEQARMHYEHYLPGQRQPAPISLMRAEAHYRLGRCYYVSDRSLEALACAEAGAATDPKHGWSALFRADLLNELKRWDEAIGAYNAVPLDFFKGPIAWRVDWLKECRAWCRLQQGDREGALADFLASLSRYEANIGLANRVDPTHLVDAAAGPLRQELHARVLALVQQLESEWYVRDLEAPPMTEPQWLASKDPQAMLQFLRCGTTRRTLGARLTRRKQVLLVLRRGDHRSEGAKANRVPRSDLEVEVDAVMQQAAELAERLLEGEGRAAKLEEVRLAIERVRTADPDPTDPINPIPDKLRSASSLLDLASGETDLVDLFGERRESHPFPLGFTPEGADLIREVFGNPFRRAPGIAPGWLAWNDGTVKQLARAIYEERAFGLMPVLADALQEAGCTDEAILDHCRGNTTHVRGCWAVDLLLGRE
jgi:tetratricopeptide (TPR) repeat protein